MECKSCGQEKRGDNSWECFQTGTRSWRFLGEQQQQHKPKGDALPPLTASSIQLRPVIPASPPFLSLERVPFPLEHYSSLVSWLGHDNSVSFSSMWVIEHNKNIKKNSFKGKKFPLPLLYNNIGALSFQTQTIAASFRFGIYQWQMAMLKINRTFELFIL